MINSFGCKKTEELFINGFVKGKKTFPTEIIERALDQLDLISNAETLNDFKTPPSNRFHALKEDLKGFYSVSINKKYRVIFKFNTVGKQAIADEVEIIDYH